MVRAAQAYVPVIIRRPHAYDFLMQEYADQVAAGEEARGTEAGIQVGVLVLPIPGFYVLDASGTVRAKAGLTSVEDVLALLRQHARP